MPAIPALRKLKKERASEFKASQGYIVRSFLKQNKTKNSNNNKRQRQTRTTKEGTKVSEI